MIIPATIHVGARWELKMVLGLLLWKPYLGYHGWNRRIGFREVVHRSYEVEGVVLLCRCFVVEKEGAPADGIRLLITSDRPRWRRERRLLCRDR